MNQRPRQAKIIYHKTAHIYFNELADILYEKQYFSYKESSWQYVISLISIMEATIHLKQKHEAPKHFARYGKNLCYVCYPKNLRTTWYFFFTYHPGEDIYFIRYIANNHVAGHLLE